MFYLDNELIYEHIIDFLSMRDKIVLESTCHKDRYMTRNDSCKKYALHFLNPLFKEVTGRINILEKLQSVVPYLPQCFKICGANFKTIDTENISTNISTYKLLLTVASENLLSPLRLRRNITLYAFSTNTSFTCYECSPTAHIPIMRENGLCSRGFETDVLQWQKEVGKNNKLDCLYIPQPEPEALQSVNSSMFGTSTTETGFLTNTENRGALIYW
jgi:hypothetical protein